MRQPTIVLDMDGKTYPVVKLIWSHYDGALVMVQAATPYDRLKSRVDLLFEVVDPNTEVIRLKGAENPNFTAVLMLS